MVIIVLAFLLPFSIDLHDIVLRFNHAPTKGHEKDVGSKTTIRVVNSQVSVDVVINSIPFYLALPYSISIHHSNVYH